jgi:hypothetical protein
LQAGSKRGVALMLMLGPVLALAALDRAVVHWDAQWAWAAREVPPLVLDPYRIEALLRTTPPGRENVVLLGNSVLEEGFDADALAARFRERGLRFPKLTLAGSPAVSFGMLAGAVANLEPRAAVYVVSPPGLRSRGYVDEVYVYDVAAVPALFTASEVLAEPRFHLNGLVGQLDVFARHRRALQRAALVWMGRLSWLQLTADAKRVGFLAGREGRDSWVNWMKDPEPDVYPNPNTRALGYLAQRLRDVGTPLIVLQAPLHPMQMKLGIGKRVARYRSYLRELAAAEGFALVGEDQVPQLDTYDFADWVHANEHGRERLTRFLGDYLEAHL